MASLLDEQIAEIAIDAEMFKRAQRSYSKDNFPDSIHLLANWQMVNNEQIYIGYQTVLPASDSPVNFGNEMMYPWPFRDKNKMDYVQIEPYIDLSANSTQKPRYYCYALEIVLEKQVDRNNTFQQYTGVGALTMAYNPKAQQTASYKVDITKNSWPYLTVKDINSRSAQTEVYLKATLKPDSQNQKIFKLDIDIVQLLGNISINVFSHTFPALRAGIDQSQQNGGIGGVIGSTGAIGAANTSSFPIKDVQLIFPSEEETLYLRRSNGLTNASTDERKIFIENYAFGWDVMEKVVYVPPQLTIDPAILGGNNYIYAYRVGEGGIRPTIVSNAAVSTQKVKLDLEIFYKVTPDIRVEPKWDLSHLFIVILKGGITIDFAGKGSAADSFKITLQGIIEWTYTETTVIRGLQYTRGSNLIGKMFIPPSGNTPSFSTAGIMEKLDAIIEDLPKSLSTTANNYENFPNIASDEGGLPKIPTFSDIDSYVRESASNLRDLVGNMGIVASYVLYHPDNRIINAVYNELLLVTGLPSSDAQWVANVQNADLQNSQSLRNILNFIRSPAHRFPIELYGRVSQIHGLISWDKFAVASGSSMLDITNLGDPS